MNYDNFSFSIYSKKNQVEKAINTLEGIILGISMDSEVSTEEKKELQTWALNNYNFISEPPLQEIIPLIEEMMSDDSFHTEAIKDITWCCNQYKMDNSYWDLITADMQRLQGILYGIISDNNITIEELDSLQSWLDNSQHLKNHFPYNEIYSLIIGVLNDKKIDEEEQKLLQSFFYDFINVPIKTNIDTKRISKYKNSISLTGVCCIEPEIEFKDHKFCITGKSKKFKRAEIAEMISKKGGAVNSQVSSKTDYLIVCNEDNPCWAFSCYGRKVEKAVEYRKNGASTCIVHESDLWDTLNL